MLACPRCKGALPETFYHAADLQPCPGCLMPLRMEVFPALWAEPEVGQGGETLVTEGESSCFYHPTKRATVACESCGRFLCALCDLDLNGQHLCPTCLQTGKRKGKIAQLDHHRTLYDSMALTLAFAPLLVPIFTIITAPCTLYTVIRRWNAPRSIVGRTRWRLVVAFIAAVLQVIGWFLLFYYIRLHSGRRTP